MKVESQRKTADKANSAESQDFWNTPLTKLGSMAEGKIVRNFWDGKGNLLKSKLELGVAKILQFACVEYEYQKPLTLKDGRQVTPTFTTQMGVIEVVNKGKVNIDEYLLSRIKESYGDLKIMVVADSNLVHGFEELGIPSVTLSSGELSTDGKTQALFIDDPSFAFDYSHILPDAEKCSVLHGHTSAVLLEIIGRPENGMILDFGEAKKIVKDCLKIMDHKLFIARRYVVDEDTETFRIKFDGHNGSFDLRVPKGSTFTLDKEATVESLAEVVLRLVAPKMPRNVEALGVYIYEGLNKGSHLLASVTHKTHGGMES